MVIIIASFMFAYAKLIVTTLVVTAVIWAAWKISAEWRAREAAKMQARDAYQNELRWRADEQHLAYLRGESHGLYGDYKPAESVFTPMEGW